MKTDIVYTGALADIPPIHPLDSLPEDPTTPGARLIPEKGGIEVLHGLVYYADASIWRSVERCTEGIRWRSHAHTGNLGNMINAPICVDSRKATIGVGVAPREEVAR